MLQYQIAHKAHLVFFDNLLLSASLHRAPCEHRNLTAALQKPQIERCPFLYIQFYFNTLITHIIPRRVIHKYTSVISNREKTRNRNIRREPCMHTIPTLSHSLLSFNVGAADSVKNLKNLALFVFSHLLLPLLNPVLISY